MIRETKSFRDYWQPMTEKLYGGKIVLPDVEPEQKGTILVLTDAAFSRLQGLADGTELRFTAPERQEHATSWNVIGKLAGSDVSLAHEGVLFSAHLDHLGVGKPMNGDSIYNGADDDASGVTAVLELARVLGQTKPRRPVWFVLFGSEEPGILGSEYFRKHPPMPLTDLAANLEFEMIGRRDPKLPADTLWMTGWKRTNLGPALVARGAHLVADPYPDQHYFERSDNLRLAQGGVVAQTISSYGLHEDYHQPSDDIAHLDFQHMETAIGSLLGPIQWLVNSNFKPEWMKGGKP
jgi:Zn-dependent M28 family amino/carboxypeptidase